jgi:hypothetical protein
VPDFVSSLLRFVLKVVLGVLAAVFALSLLAAALLVLAFGFLQALITGKKPTPAAVFSRFRAYQPQDMWGGKTKPAGEVVDVEMREVRKTGETPDTASNAQMNDHGVATTRRSAFGTIASDHPDANDATDVTDKNSTRRTDSAS